MGKITGDMFNECVKPTTDYVCVLRTADGHVHISARLPATQASRIRRLETLMVPLLGFAAREAGFPECIPTDAQYAQAGVQKEPSVTVREILDIGPADLDSILAALLADEADEAGA